MSNNPDAIHVPISVCDWSKNLANTINAKLNTVHLLPVGRCCCIYRVHKKFYAINKCAYVPEMISIGPLHHDNKVLQEMEDNKLQYLNKYFSRMNDGKEKLEECVEAIKEVEDAVRQCYFEHVEPDKEKFVQMMLADGIFAIELFHRYSFGQDDTQGDDTQGDDPVVYRWNLMSLARDMILMENQLPMEVLKRLYAMTMTNQQDRKPLSELAIKFFSLLMPREENVLKNYFRTEGKHLLDLLRKTFVQCFPEKLLVSNNVGMTTTLLELKHVPVPCATELRRAGISFKKHSNAHSFLDIKFTKSAGEMEIPSIRIICQTESLLRNLIASEHCCDGKSTYLASYAFIMCDLIRSVDDVALLTTCGIIENYFGGDEIVCSIFNNLCKEVSLPNFYYSEICEQVNDFRKSPWQAWKAKMMRNPYNALSLIVAVVSALFSILSFAIHNS